MINTSPINMIEQQNDNNTQGRTASDPTLASAAPKGQNQSQKHLKGGQIQENFSDGDRTMNPQANSGEQRPFSPMRTISGNNVSSLETNPFVNRVTQNKQSM